MTADATKEASPTGFEQQLFEAIRVQRPAVIAHIHNVRRTKPDATPAEALKALESGYLAAVTTASAGVGAAAAIPGVGTTAAVGLSAADLLLFFELSALYALSVAEVHGLTVTDPERAKVIVLGMVMGDDSQARVTQLVAGAVGGADRSNLAGVVGDVTKASAALKDGAWGDVVATAVPNGQLNPLVKQMLMAGAVKLGAKAGGGTIAKILPFGLGAVVGGTASFFFGKSVVTASRNAFTAPPTEWPEWLEVPDEDGDGIPDPPRSLVMMREAADNAKNFTEDVWGRVSDGAAIAGSSVATAAGAATRAFRSVDLDGDGIPDEPQALTAVKGTAGAIAGAAGALGGRMANVLKREKKAATVHRDDASGNGEVADSPA
ncbi:hypothetical protein ACH0AH_08115 [Microbacterium paludicola]|uniref:hypothetical protein n=1 Tax=Microbacterium paludicola TaxID=300019 RepID=UPI003878F553